ncbi:MAG: hypothetical protein ABEK16_01650 [Candidatus Nanohalobium sp.]
MGMDVGSPEEVAEISDSLFRAPVARYEEDSFIVNNPGSGQEAEGRVSLRAARRMLGGAVDEGDEIVVRMVEAGRSPEYADTYDAALEVDQLSEEVRDAIPKHAADPFMLEEIPDGFQYGSNYDFTVIDSGSNEYVLGDTESLQDWR